jgi:polysaccharide biosynthesis transport protein
MSSFSQANPTISIADALGGVWRRKFFILCMLILGMLAGLAILKLIKPSYQSEAQVLIEKLATPYEKTTVSTDQRGEAVTDREVLSQVSVIKSGDMTARVASKLSLTEKPEFNPLLKSVSSFKAFLIAWGFSDDPQLMTPEQLALKNIDSHLTVYQIPESNTIGIKYQAGDAQTAADIANGIAEAYVLSTRETEAGSTNRARDWLAQQIADLRNKVSTAENEVEKYRSEAGLLQGEKSTLGTQQISELNSQITLAEAASTEAAARADEIRNLLTQKGTVDASSDVLSSPVIQNLREQQVGASRKISELSATYLPNHPKMVAAQQELISINRNIRSEAAKVVDSLIGQAKVAGARAKSLRDSLGRLKSSQSGLNLSDVKLKELQRDADASRVLLEQMLSRYADANARQDLSLQPGYARIIQKATPMPSNYFPKAGPILTLTSLGGLGLGLGLSFLFSVMAATSRRAEFGEDGQVSVQQHPARATLDLDEPIPSLTVKSLEESLRREQNVAAAVVVSAPAEKTLAVLSALPSATNLTTTLALMESTYSGGPSELTAAAHRLAAACLAMKDQQGPRCFALTSIGGRQMDSSVATVAVARALSKLKKKVIAIDLCSTNSAFETLFELAQGSGISDLVAGEADFTKVISRDPHSNAHTIRYGLKTSTAYQPVVADKLGPVLKALVGIYDIILLHAGEASSTTPQLIKDCDATMILAPQQRYKDAVAAARLLEQKGMAISMFVRLEPTGDADLKRAVGA